MYVHATFGYQNLYSMCISKDLKNSIVEAMEPSDLNH
jgi:hypothetical protein